MISRRLSRTLAAVIAVVVVGPACGDEDGSPAPPPSPGAGSAGAAGNARAGGAGQMTKAGAAGQTPKGGAAGAPVATGGQAGQAGSPAIAGAGGKTGGAGGAPAGGAPPVGGSGGGPKGGSGGGPKGGAPSGGAAGAAGGSGAGVSGYPSDQNPGPNIIPTSCALAHGEYGCCGPDGNAYIGDYPNGVIMEACSPLFPCAWSSGDVAYRCGGDEKEAPFGVLPPRCGLPALPPATCVESYCKEDAQCDPAVWGPHAHCSKTEGHCVRCDVDADCPADRFCAPPSLGICQPRLCGTDAECAAKDPSRPACDPVTHACAVCVEDKHCTAIGENGCFVGSCGCKNDAACASSPAGHWCDEIGNDCGCRAAADCPANAPVCVDRVCGSCVDDAQCKNAVGKPYCGIQGSVHTCMACRKDTDCSQPASPFCVDGACMTGCQTSFSCSGDAPVCQIGDGGLGSCGPAPACAGDDDHEALDDNPLTASLKLDAGASIAGNICGLPGERDHFPVTLTATGDVVLTVSSPEPRVFVALSDSAGRLLGLSIHGKPKRLHVRSLAAGTYYAAVGIAVNDGTSAAVPYSLQRLGGGAPCTSDASCGDTTATEIYRGRCDLPSGACAFIEGKGALGPMASCDDDTDCQTGFCSGYAFAGNPGERSRCSAPCDGPSPLGQVPSSELCAAAGLDDKWICTEFEQVNRCLPRCKTADDCPIVDLIASPPAGKPWLHMTCSPQGRCEHF